MASAEARWAGLSKANRMALLARVSESRGVAAEVTATLDWNDLSTAHKLGIQGLWLNSDHNTDADCAGHVVDGDCTVCGVNHGAACPECHGRGFHLETCSAWATS